MIAAKIRILINPAAGRPEPVLATLERVLGETGIEWQVDTIGSSGEVGELVQAAVKWGAGAIGVYGGDGTVSAVADAASELNIPLGVLPGGTGNVMAAELGVPSEIEDACRQLFFGGKVCRVDLGRVNGRTFVLRVGIGLEAKMVAEAEPQLKAKFGRLAYALAALGALQDREVIRFRVEVDGDVIETEAITCVVANSGNLGRPGLRFAPDIQIDDGLLDVVLLRKADLQAVAALVQGARGELPRSASIERMKGKRLRIDADPSREVQVDGETGVSLPLGISVIPGQLQMLVPNSTDEGD